MLGISGIVRIFEEIEQRLIQSLKRNLSRHKEEEEQEGEEEASPDMDGCPAVKVGRAGTWEGLFWGK